VAEFLPESINEKHPFVTLRLGLVRKVYQFLHQRGLTPLDALTVLQCRRDSLLEQHFSCMV